MDENKELTLSLKIRDWNRIRAGMGKLPYEQINDLFIEMDRQFEPQLMPRPGLLQEEPNEAE